MLWSLLPLHTWGSEAVAPEPVAAGTIVLVVHRDNPMAVLSQRQVMDMYMGRLRSFPDGEVMMALDYPTEAAIKAQFYQRLVGRSLAQVYAYWSRLVFTGSATPPQQLGSAEEMLTAVATNRAAIGYVYANQITGAVKVVAYLKPGT